MATLYPSQIDTNITLPSAIDNSTPVEAIVVNRLRDAIIAIESELGVKPSGIYGTVRARLDVLEALIQSGGGGGGGTNVVFSGDLSGVATHQTVVGLGGRPFNTSLPSVGQAIMWDGTNWSPSSDFGAQNITTSGSITSGPVSTTSLSTGLASISGKVIINGVSGGAISDPGQGIIYYDSTLNKFRASENGGSYVDLLASSGPAGGDLSGTYPNPVVAQIQTYPVSATAPVNSAVLVWNTSSYDVRQLTEDDILPGFNITGFSGGSTVEVGATVNNPSFTASYTHTPTSANITNTDGINSPFSLTTPFTSATITGSFTHSSVTTVVFTLTAIYGVTRTATQNITFLARSFGGVGGPAATSATASGSNAVLVGASGTLSDEGLHSSDVGQNYGPFSPVGQKIYLLLPHTATPHSFKDQNGFTFPMNSPTTFSFTNQNGAAISMDLYESTNLLSTPFTLLVVS